MTRKPSRARSTHAHPAVRLLRAVLALALAFLTVPFLAISPAHADDLAAPPDTAIVETTDPPPEPDSAAAPEESPAEPVVEENALPDEPEANDEESGPAPLAKEAAVQDDEEADTPKKVVVCKFVTTPGEDEVFSHVIIVSTSALGQDWDGTFPAEFADAHFNSVAIRYAEEGEHADDVSDTECVTPPPPPPCDNENQDQDQIALDDDCTPPPPPDDNGKKVVVCKFVTTPGEDEVFSHVIIVSTSALGQDWDGTFPAEFADAHFNSVAIRYAEEGEHADDVSDTECVTPPPPPPCDNENQDQDQIALDDDCTPPPPPDDNGKKVVVCKWVKTPGENEVFSHVIIVSENALGEGFDGDFPFDFSDAQEHSKAIRWAEEGEQAKDVDPSECTGSWELDKSVAITSGDGDSFAEPGEQLTYTLTLHNTSDSVAVTNASVTDDISGVVDNGAIVETALELAFRGIVRSGDELTWTVPGPVAPGDSVSAWYTVLIGPGQWGQTLHNIATPDGDLGTCVAKGECETTTRIPDVTTMVVEKRDLESDDVLAGATFELWSLGPVPEGGCDFPSAPGEDAVLVGSVPTEADGQALFHEIQHGCYLLIETDPPAGYELPEDPVMGVQVDEENFAADEEMSPIVVTNFAEGQLAIVAKRQFEFINGAWVESDGIVNFGDTVRYVVRVSATGPRNFHDVRVTDYIPGFNPSDTKSTVKGTLVPGSAKCDEGLTCSVSVGPENKVTWDIGDLEPDAGVTVGGSAVMDVVFPPLPAGLVLEPGQSFSASLWNVGFLDWNEAVPVALLRSLAGRSGGGGTGVASLAAIDLPLVAHHLVSNEVLVTATVTAAPAVKGSQVKADGLPQTGAPAWISPLGLLSSVLIALGAGMVRRRKESAL